MAITLNGTTGITTPALDSEGNLEYSGTLTGGTGVVNLGSGQVVKDANGNVGIGTSTPARKLDVNGNIQANNIFFTGRLRAEVDGTAAAPAIMPGNDGDTGFFRPSNNVIGFSTGGTERLTVSTSAFIGSLPWRGQNGTAGAPAISFSSDTDTGIFRAGVNSLGIATGGNQRVRVFANGLVTVNSNGTSRNDFGLKFLTSSTASTILAVHRQANDGNVAEFGRGGNAVGSISVTNTATSYNTSSDYRLKENLVPITDALTRVAAIPVYRFNFIADPTKTVDGFVAHELAPHLPEAVTGEKDEVQTVDVTDDEGNVTGTKVEPVLQGVDQSKITPLLTAAIQEQQTLIQALTARIEALEQA